MKNKVLQLVAALLGTWLAATPAVALERGEVPERYKWDLGSLFADEAQWVAAKDGLRADIPALVQLNNQPLAGLGFSQLRRAAGPGNMLCARSVAGLAGHIDLRPGRAERPAFLQHH